MPFQEESQPPPFAEETDEDLLAYVAMQDEDHVGAEAAFTEFHRRHHRYVFYVCKRYRGLLGEDGVSDLAQETLLRVYQKAHTYDPAKAIGESPTRRVRAWMGSVVANLVVSLLRQHPEKEELIDDPDDLDKKEYGPLFQSISPDEEGAVTPRMKLFLQALSTLSERERDIVIVWAEWCRLGQKFQRLPDDISQELASRYKSTPEGIRQIRKRAKEKIKSYVESHEKRR
jgi:RNA polymerase sigma factor (sigma-70 family)